MQVDTVRDIGGKAKDGKGKTSKSQEKTEKVKASTTCPVEVGTIVKAHLLPALQEVGHKRADCRKRVETSLATLLGVLQQMLSSEPRPIHLLDPADGRYFLDLCSVWWCARLSRTWHRWFHPC